MSLNTAHANNGVLIHAGEAILLFSENVNMEFSGQDAPIFKGTKQGKIYLTTHRMIYNAKNSSDGLQSFSFPFVCLNEVELEQPVFGANYIKGKVRAQENGQFIGEAKFKLLFKGGGAIDFAQAMLRAAHMAKTNSNNAPPPPYTPPSGAWHEAPPPAYSPNPNGYYGWMPSTQAFPNSPPPNTVFMYDNPPPYPGIVPPQSYNSQVYPASGYGGYQQPGGYSTPQTAYVQPSQPGYPPQPSAGAGYPPQPAAGAGYPPQPSAGAGYPPQPAAGAGYPPQPAAGTGYPPLPSAGAGYPPQPATGAGYPPQPSASAGYPQWGNPGAANGFGGYPGGPPSYTPGAANPAGGYGAPQPTGAMGFNAPPNSKEQEAAQSAYNPQPQQPPQPYAPPPPAYYEPPPNYNSLNFKRD